VFPQSPKKKSDRKKEREDEADAKYLHCAGLFSEDHDGEEWVRSQQLFKGATHYLCELSEKLYTVRTMHGTAIKIYPKISHSEKVL
jgi:hypothetical protein